MDYRWDGLILYKGAQKGSSYAESSREGADPHLGIDLNRDGAETKDLTFLQQLKAQITALEHEVKYLKNFNANLVQHQSLNDVHCEYLKSKLIHAKVVATFDDEPKNA